MAIWADGDTSMDKLVPNTYMLDLSGYTAGTGNTGLYQLQHGENELY